MQIKKKKKKKKKKKNMLLASHQVALMDRSRMRRDETLLNKVTVLICHQYSKKS